MVPFNPNMRNHELSVWGFSEKDGICHALKIMHTCKYLEPNYCLACNNMLAG